MESRQKGTIILSGDDEKDKLRVLCINKVLEFDGSFNLESFDFIFGQLQNRPKRLVKLLISLDCLDNLDKIAAIIFNTQN